MSVEHAPNRLDDQLAVADSEFWYALVDERVDLHDLTATVVDLAVKGYLRIRVDQKELLFGLWKKEETWFERTDP